MIDSELLDLNVVDVRTLRGAMSYLRANGVRATVAAFVREIR